MNSISACLGDKSTSSLESFAKLGMAFVMRRVQLNFLPLAAMVN
jgi:hypothetical protein